jgi:Holliday junction resolvasome RuvABC endonuclease subunit
MKSLRDPRRPGLSESDIGGKVGERKAVTVLGFAPSTVKKHICGNGRASKKEVARVIVSKYPELKVYLTQDRAWKE